MTGYPLVHKMQAVVRSCKTVDQLINARKYLLQCDKFAATAEDGRGWLVVTEAVDELDAIITDKLCELSNVRGMRAVDTGVIKLGIDIHGVIDKAPELFTLISKLPVEVHIITGIKEELDNDVPNDLEYDYWFSIHEQCEIDGVEITYDEQNRPHVDPDIWDNMKARYCKEQGITMLIDDSPHYASTFEGLDTLYLQLTNTKRNEWRK